MALDTLTDRERRILDLEQRWWATTAGKEDAIRAIGLSPVRYYQLLNQLVATQRATEYAAITVNRLRRIANVRSRSARVK
jgi:hypothetical protein